MKNLDCTCGIYDTEYTLTSHRDGSVTVRIPYIKWTNNTGILEFRREKYSGNAAALIKKCFKDQTHMLDGYEFATLRDVLERDVK